MNCGFCSKALPENFKYWNVERDEKYCNAKCSLLRHEDINMDYETRKAQAEGMRKQGLDNVENDKEPEGQKFPCGSRVHIADDLGGSMSHFTSGCDATVLCTYAHAYGGDDFKSYSLDIDGLGEESWYEEGQLTLL